MIDQWWLLLALGIGVGALGTLIGVGGGFILVPVLLFMMPGAKADQITAISLAVVFLNSLSGSIAYLRMKRVDVHSAIWFGLATVPGAIVGAFATKLIDRNQFNLIFGGILFLGGIYLLARPGDTGAIEETEPPPGRTVRELTDREGTTHSYHFPMPLGVGMSVGVGFLSSFLGIGGGIIHVPLLTRVLNFPVHIATATSQVILGVMALAGTAVHIGSGNLSDSWDTVLFVGLGAVIGAQLGARLSRRIHGAGIVRILAVALGVVGIRILWSALG